MLANIFQVPNLLMWSGLPTTMDMAASNFSLPELPYAYDVSLMSTDS
jgi:hypothetical protein